MTATAWTCKPNAKALLFWLLLVVVVLVVVVALLTELQLLPTAGQHGIWAAAHVVAAVMAAAATTAAGAAATAGPSPLPSPLLHLALLVLGQVLLLAGPGINRLGPLLLLLLLKQLRVIVQALGQ